MTFALLFFLALCFWWLCSAVIGWVIGRMCDLADRIDRRVR